MAYIKSKSHYTLKSKTQTLKDGNSQVFEQDLATIGGLVRVADGQIPIYQSGNFIITTNGVSYSKRDIGHESWLTTTKINDSGATEEVDYWDSESVGEIGFRDDSNKIVLKQDYYSLSDFSYYGSCSELIRASITDIINKFPGELYNTNLGIFYLSPNDRHSSDEDGTDWLGGSDNEGNSQRVVLDNPFDVDLHTHYINPNDVKNPLKYFTNGGWENYEIILFDDKNNEEDRLSITKYENTISSDTCVNIGNAYEGAIVIEASSETTSDFTCTIKAYVGSLNKLYYLVEAKNPKKYWSIRPKKEYLAKFYNGLDNFEKILLNKDSAPKYTAIFEVIKDSDYGYYKQLQKFTFPTTYGGYNLSVDDALRGTYIQSLVEASAMYDELFCDNLWRSMTHEAIKNFDWTYTRKYVKGEDPIYKEGGLRIQKLIRLFGREFDEIKSFIDGIQAYNSVTYDDINNAPDYVLSDLVDIKGFEVYNIYPINCKLSEDGSKLIDVSEDISSIIKPYNEKEKHKGASYPIYTSDKTFTMNQVNNHFMKVLRINAKDIMQRKGTIEGIETLLSLFGLKSKRWVDKLSQFQKDKMNHYCKGFKPIKDDKKSKDVENLEDDDSRISIHYDYEIDEFVSITEGIVDPRLSDGWFYFDWINSTKNISYPTTEFANGIYVPYQGLPIRGYNVSVFNKEENTYSINRYIYPYYSNNKIIDGDPYYQMYGGWLRKNTRQYDKDNNILEGENNLLFTQTLKTTKVVDDLQSMFSLVYDELKDGEIVRVSNTSGDWLVVDGILYPIHYDRGVVCVSPTNRTLSVTVSVPNTVEGSDKIEKKEKIYELPQTSKYTYGEQPKHPFGEYIKAYTSNGKLIVGKKTFEGIVFVSDWHQGYSISDNPKIILNKHNVSLYDDNVEVRIYLTEGSGIYVADQTQTLGQVFRWSNISTDNEYSDYFILGSREHKNELNGDGWFPLKKTDPRFIRLNSIVDTQKGNNPHVSKSYKHYDDGYKYMEYLVNPFKYAVEESDFNQKCYQNYGDYLKALDMVKLQVNGDGEIQYETEDENSEHRCLFENVIVDGGFGCTDCVGTYSLVNDSKVHCFGNYYYVDDDKKAQEDKFNVFDTSSETLDKWSFFDKFNSSYSVEGNKIEYSDSKENPYDDLNPIGKTGDKIWLYKKAEFSDTNSWCTDQIINTKRVNIRFHLRFSNKKENEKGEREKEMKYLDAVVIPYLQQVLPTNIIAHIIYD